MLNGRQLDNSGQVILWQVGVVGDWTFKQYGYDLSALPLLLERLYEFYPPINPVVVYEAATLPGCEPAVRTIPLWALPQAGLTAASTLYISPARSGVSDPIPVSRMQALRT